MIRTKPLSRIVWLTMAFCAGTAFCAHAQSYGRVEQTQSNLDSYRYFVEPGAAAIRVSVLGPVKYPGIYEITKGSDLLKVLTLSGGPDPSRVEFVNKQRTTIKLYRNDSGGASSKLIFESVLEKTAVDSAAFPELQEGDVITVSAAAWRRFDWRDVLTIVNVVNTIVLIIIAFDSLNS